MTRTTIDLWTVYEHPTDYPDHFVARRFELDEASGDVVIGVTLEDVRAQLPGGLVNLGRMPDDEPHIVEVWV